MVRVPKGCTNRSRLTARLYANRRLRAEHVGVEQRQASGLSVRHGRRRPPGRDSYLNMKKSEKATTKANSSDFGGRLGYFIQNTKAVRHVVTRNGGSEPSAVAERPNAPPRDGSPAVLRTEGVAFERRRLEPKPISLTRNQPPPSSHGGERLAMVLGLVSAEVPRRPSGAQPPWACGQPRPHRTRGGQAGAARRLVPVLRQLLCSLQDVRPRQGRAGEHGQPHQLPLCALGKMNPGGPCRASRNKTTEGAFP